MKFFFVNVLFFLSIGIVPCLFAQEKFTSSKKTWNVGVGLFETDSTDLPALSAANLLGKLILNQLSSVEKHKLSDEERLILANEVLQEKKKQHIQTLDKLYADLDALLFDLNTSANARTDQRDKIADERKKQAETQITKPIDVAVPENLDINFLKMQDGSKLWRIDDIPPEIVRKTQDLDLLITGKIIKVGDYLGISAYALNETGKVNLWEGAGSEAELADIARSIVTAVRGIVLGRVWSAISISVEPNTALISTNDKFVGVGNWSDDNLFPGEINIEITAYGYKPIIQKIILAPGEQEELSINLEQIDKNEILLSSKPAGANVRLGTLWLGTTPLSVPVPDRLTALTLEKEGFRERTIPFTPGTERLIIPLEESHPDPEEYVNNLRKKFNNAGTWFTFSLAPTVLLYGMNRNFRNRSEIAVDDGERSSAQQGIDITSGLQITSLIVNGGLLTITLIRLIRYLNAVEELGK